MNPDDPCVLEVDRRGDHTFVVAAFIVYAMGPFVTLVYILPVDKVKTVFKEWKNKLSDTSTTTN